MDFKTYQIESRKTAIYPDQGKNIIYTIVGLAGEAGEVAGTFAKIMRDDNSIMTEEKKILIVKEAGDVLWYISQICSELGIELDELAQINLDKLKSRQERGKIGGSGNDR